jgi:hypothetical protein
MQLERLIEKKVEKPQDELKNKSLLVEMEINIALDRLRSLNNKEKEYKEERKIMQEEKEITDGKENGLDQEEITSVTYSILDEMYTVQFQETFYYQSVDHGTLYAHMGNATHTMQSRESYTTRELTRQKEQHKGEMRNGEAQETVQRIIYLNMFGVDNMSVEEKEQFTNWRHFNKSLRRLYEATASVRYKQVHLKTMPMRS